MSISAPVESVQFGGLDIAFDNRVLRPRPWTLAQSEWAAELLSVAPPGPVLELFAGVGHIGLAAVLDSDRDLMMVDVNLAAVQLARRNADAAGLQGRVVVRHGRIDEVLESGERFPLIVADPPWVPTAGVAEFPDDPTIAIDGGADGLALARSCCRVVDAHLDVDGSAILQLGTLAQVDAVAGYLADELASMVRVVETRTFDRGVLTRLFR